MNSTTHSPNVVARLTGQFCARLRTATSGRRFRPSLWGGAVALAAHSRADTTAALKNVCARVIGLSADTGRVLGDAAVRAAHTLSLLTLKPGLFTADGREHAGQVWWHGLGLASATAPPQAWLSGRPGWPPRGHGQHKGSFGDVLVLGGAAGMGGAALLAARAALACGAGRVFIARLDPAEALAVDPQRPELMPRRPESLLSPAVLGAATVVCGCGGGTAVAECLPAVLADAARLVLDADALNAIAGSTALQAALLDRASRQRPTLLTPHPLEAARLLGTTTAAIQADRLAQAQALPVFQPAQLFDRRY